MPGSASGSKTRGKPSRMEITKKRLANDKKSSYASSDASKPHLEGDLKKYLDIYTGEKAKRKNYENTGEQR